jgi:tetraacyldisaccharide 4'-kinase
MVSSQLPPEPAARAGRAAAPFLAVLAHAWRLGVRIDRALTRPRMLPRPVVSVGNISLGGTGKTPFVIYLARAFSREGLRPAVLTRGYRSEGGACDEPRVIARGAPGVRVLVDRDRHRAASAALAGAEPPDIFILDDGFQHWALGRDADIVLVDALRPFGTGKVFPAGTLREDVDALARAHAVVFTRADLVPPATLEGLCAEVGRRFPSLVVACAREEVCAYEDLAGEARAAPREPVFAVCGIGNPASFFVRAGREGVAVSATASLPDHYRWAAADVASIEARARAAAAGVVLTTAKDATKILPEWARMPWAVMAIETRITEGEAALWAMLRARTAGEKRRHD